MTTKKINENGTRQCLDCNLKYSPNIQTGGRFARGYTKCPKCK